MGSSLDSRALRKIPHGIEADSALETSETAVLPWNLGQHRELHEGSRILEAYASPERALLQYTGGKT